MPDNSTVPGLDGGQVLLQNCTIELCSLEYAQLSYIPSKNINAAYLAIFAILFLGQAVRGVLYRTWGFTIGMLFGLLLEVIGYAARLMLHNNPFDFDSFVMYLVCLTIGPAFLSAAIYLCLSRLVIVYGVDIAPYKPRTYTITFICCDIVSLVLQSLGGALAATANDPAGSHLGTHIMVAGLVVQVLSLLIFMFVATQLTLRIRKAGHHAFNPDFASLRARPLFRYFPIALLIATITIFIRCVFRVAELSAGFNSALANNEVTFSILEGPMIMIAAVVLTALHPGFCFGGNWKDANWAWRAKNQKVSQRTIDYTGEVDHVKSEQSLGA